MKAKIYYRIGDFNDELIIESDTIEGLREKCDSEISLRGAVYTSSEIIEK